MKSDRNYFKQNTLPKNITYESNFCKPLLIELMNQKGIVSNMNTIEGDGHLMEIQHNLSFDSTDFSLFNTSDQQRKSYMINRKLGQEFVNDCEFTSSNEIETEPNNSHRDSMKINLHHKQSYLWSSPEYSIVGSKDINANCNSRVEVCKCRLGKTKACRVVLQRLNGLNKDIVKTPAQITSSTKYLQSVNYSEPATYNPCAIQKFSNEEKTDSLLGSGNEIHNDNSCHVILHRIEDKLRYMDYLCLKPSFITNLYKSRESIKNIENENYYCRKYNIQNCTVELQRINLYNSRKSSKKEHYYCNKCNIKSCKVELERLKVEHY